MQELCKSGFQEHCQSVLTEHFLISSGSPPQSNIYSAWLATEVLCALSDTKWCFAEHWGGQDTDCIPLLYEMPLIWNRCPHLANTKAAAEIPSESTVNAIPNSLLLLCYSRPLWPYCYKGNGLSQSFPLYINLSICNGQKGTGLRFKYHEGSPIFNEQCSHIYPLPNTSSAHAHIPKQTEEKKTALATDADWRFTTLCVYLMGNMLLDINCKPVKFLRKAERRTVGRTCPRILSLPFLMNVRMMASTLSGIQVMIQEGDWVAEQNDSKISHRNRI